MIPSRHPSPATFIPQAPMHYPVASTSTNHNPPPPQYPQRQPIASSLLARTLSAGTPQQPPQPTYIPPQPIPHNQAYSSQPLAYHQSNQNQNNNLYRREGRTVPTSSDMFDKRRIDSTTPGSGSSDSMLGAWAKQHDQRVVSGTNGNGSGGASSSTINGNGNGSGHGIGNVHGHGHITPLMETHNKSTTTPPSHPLVKETSAQSSHIQTTTNHGSRYPGLSDYLGTKGILSPPKGGGPLGMGGYLSSLGGGCDVLKVRCIADGVGVGRSPYNNQGTGSVPVGGTGPLQR
jgi:hypothetical protein